jgi:hypothetical protein
MTQDTQKINELEKKVDELRNIVANLIPYDRNELSDKKRKELREINQQEPFGKYNPEDSTA